MQNGKFVLGTWCDIPSSALANVVARAGLDFLIIDMEHGAMSYETALNMIMAAESENCSALIRVPRLDESNILRALDLGGSGIIVPHVECKEDCDLIVKYSKYFPLGERGYNPYIRAGSYHNNSLSELDQSNKEKVIAIIVEGKKAIENFDEILLNQSIDIIYIGIYDLSMSLGLPGEVTNPIVLNTMEDLLIRINNSGKIAGCMVHNKEDIRKYKDLGVLFQVYKVDTSVIYDSYKMMKEELNK